MNRLSLERLRGSDTDRDTVRSIFNSCPEYFELSVGRAACEEEVDALFGDLPGGKTLEDKYVYRIGYEGRIIGIIDVISDYPEKGVAYIGQFILRRSFQERGFGREAFELLKSRGNYDEYRLLVNVNNAGARAFWRSMGFVKTEKVLDYFCEGFSGPNIELAGLTTGNG